MIAPRNSQSDRSSPDTARLAVSVSANEASLGRARPGVLATTAAPANDALARLILPVPSVLRASRSLFSACTDWRDSCPDTLTLPNRASSLKVASSNPASPLKVAQSNPAFPLKATRSNPAFPMKVAPTNRASPLKVAPLNRASSWNFAPSNVALPLKVASSNPGPSEFRRVEPGAGHDGCTVGGLVEQGDQLVE